MGYTLEQVQTTQPGKLALKDMPPPPGVPPGGFMVEVDYCGRADHVDDRDWFVHVHPVRVRVLLPVRPDDRLSRP